MYVEALLNNESPADGKIENMLSNQIFFHTTSKDYVEHNESLHDVYVYIGEQFVDEDDAELEKCTKS